jgi:hypothetical protein
MIWKISEKLLNTLNSLEVLSSAKVDTVTPTEPWLFIVAIFWSYCNCLNFSSAFGLRGNGITTVRQTLPCLD